MKTEKYYRKKAGFIFLFDLILIFVSVLVFILAVRDPLTAAYTAGEGVDIESLLNEALPGVIALVVMDIVSSLLTLIWWITFIKLWKYYGPRFWRCTWVILGALSYAYLIVGIVLLLGFGINILYV